MAIRHEALFGIKPGLTYDVKLKGPDGQVVESYGGIVTRLKRSRRRYKVQTIEETGQGEVRNQEYNLETMLSGGTGILELDLDVPGSPNLMGISKVFTLSRLILATKKG